MNKNEFEQYAEKMAFESKCRQQALMYLNRTKKSGMPYLRVTKEEFSTLLSVPYHAGGDDDDVDAIQKVKEFSNLIFDGIKEILKIPFVLIDGGSEKARKKAGCALLFKMIISDRHGLYVTCTSLQEQLKSMSFSRIDLINDCKKYDVLFISEFSKSLFKIHNNDAGDLFDEILRHRADYNKVTIISFTDAISRNYNDSQDKRCGSYFADLSLKEYSDSQNHYNNPANNILRIRVKGL